MSAAPFIAPERRPRVDAARPPAAARLGVWVREALGGGADRVDGLGPRSLAGRFAGYRRADYFARQFRRIHGLTPKAWRDAHLAR